MRSSRCRRSRPRAAARAGAGVPDPAAVSGAADVRAPAQPTPPSAQPAQPHPTAEWQPSAPASATGPQQPAERPAPIQQPVAPQAPTRASADRSAPAKPAERPAFDAIFGISDAASHETTETTALRRRVVDTTPTSEAEQADRPVGRSSASSVSASASASDGRTARSEGRTARREEAPGFDALFAGLGDDDADELDGPGERGHRGGRSVRADRKAAKASKAEKPAKPAKAEKPAKPAKGGKLGRRSSAASAAGPRRTGSVPAAPAPVDGDLAMLVAGMGSAAANGLGAAAGTASAAGAALVSGAAAATAPAFGAERVSSAASGIVPPVDATAGFAAAIAAAAGALPGADTSTPSAPSAAPAPAPLNLEASSRRGDRSRASQPAPTVPADVTGVDDLLGFGAAPEPFHGDAAEQQSAPRRGDDRTSSARREAPRSEAPRRESPRSDSPRRDVPRADATKAGTATRRSASVAVARPSARPAASAPRRRRTGGRVVSMVAMSFAALLAVATTIPSLSLLTPADVQALALSNYGTDSLDGQRVVLNGDIVAQSMQREGYESQTIQEYAQAAGIRAESDFTNNPAGTIQWPFAVGVHIGDHFGYRDCAGCSSDHGGQDFNPGYGAEIQAIADGTVAVSTDSGGSLGVVMMIDHMIDGELITSVYAHMIEGSRRFEVGDTVHVADVIGQTGNTGMSTGPHLHFEIRLGGVDGTKVDPLEWLYANTN